MKNLQSYIRYHCAEHWLKGQLHFQNIMQATGLVARHDGVIVSIAQFAIDLVDQVLAPQGIDAERCLKQQIIQAATQYQEHMKNTSTPSTPPTLPTPLQIKPGPARKPGPPAYTFAQEIKAGLDRREAHLQGMLQDIQERKQAAIQDIQEREQAADSLRQEIDQGKKALAALAPAPAPPEKCPDTCPEPPPETRPAPAAQAPSPTPRRTTIHDLIFSMAGKQLRNGVWTEQVMNGLTMIDPNPILNVTQVSRDLQISTKLCLFIYNLLSHLPAPFHLLKLTTKANKTYYKLTEQGQDLRWRSLAEVQEEANQIVEQLLEIHLPTGLYRLSAQDIRQEAAAAWARQQQQQRQQAAFNGRPPATAPQTAPVLALQQD